MQRRNLIILSAVTVALFILSLWVHFGGSDEEFRPKAMSADELAALKPDLDGDARLLAEMRRLSGFEPGAWQQLPPICRAIYATLWAEEVQRTMSWAQLAMADDQPDLPSLADIADAYGTLGQPKRALAMRALAQDFAAERQAWAAWLEARKAGQRPPAPDGKRVEAAARTVFTGLDAVRTKRLELVRANAAELGLAP